MTNERLCFSSQTIEIAENGNYLELINRVCFYNAANLNGTLLPYDDSSLDKAKTLVNMPVVAKYTKNSKNEPTFKGHEVYIDAEGNIQFGTDNIGTHIDVFIKEDSVDVQGEIKVLPCLFAKYRIWKRNANVVAAAKRLFSENKLFSSWELSTISYVFNNGIKTLVDYEFLSNCLLGYENSKPAYGPDAKAIQMSNNENLLLVAEAFSKDILENSDINNFVKKEDENLEKENAVLQAEDESVENLDNNHEESENAPAIEDGVAETSALTDHDLRKAIREAIAKKLVVDECDFYILFSFPSNGEVWIQKWEADSELDIIKILYTVENDVVTVGDPAQGKLAVSVGEINSTVASLNEKIAEQTNSLVEANSKLQELSTEIIGLSQFKDKLEKIEQEQIEKETSAKREEIKSYAIKSGFIAQEELVSDETIRLCVENLDQAGLKTIIADRFMDSLKKDAKDGTSTTTATQAQAIPNLSDGGDAHIDYKSIIKSFINK